MRTLHELPAKRLVGATAIAASLLAGSGAVLADEKISLKAPGSDTTLTISGYVKLDAIWSDCSAGVDSVGDQTLSINTVQVGPTACQHKKNQVTMHARQSRLSVGTSTPSRRSNWPCA